MAIDLKKKIELCHIITDLDVGGAEFMLKRLLEQEPEYKERVVVISLMDHGKIGQQLMQAGFTVYALNMKGKLAFPLALLRLTRLLRQLQPLLVQTWMYHADLLGGLAAYFAGIKTIVWGIHCTKLPIGRPLTWAVMKACALLSYKIPSHIVCVADAARQMHINYGYKSALMSVIPNGFAINPLLERPLGHQALLQFPQSPAPLVVGAVGRFHPDKGQDILLNAAALVVEKRPDIVFVLAGRQCDNNNPALQQQIAAKGLQKQVILLGERDDVPQLLTEFDMFCLPSRSEAFPVALGEAMLAALPCVATDVGDCRWLTGDIFPLIPQGDAAVLAQAILEMTDKPAAERHQLGVKARQRVIELFSIDSVSKRYRQLYRQLNPQFSEQSKLE